MINGDLVRLGLPDDVIRRGTDTITLEFAYDEPLSERDRDRPHRSEQAMRISLSRDRDLLVVSELSVWQDDHHLISATASTPPDGVDLVDGETALTVANPEESDLPDATMISFQGIRPYRILYRISRDEIVAALESIFRHASEGSPFAFDTLYSVVTSSRLARDDDPDPSLVSLANKLRQGRTRPDRAREFELTENEKNLLHEAFEEVQAPNGWASEPIARYRMGGTQTGFRGGPVSERYAQAHSTLSAMLDRMTALASSVRYLGPLRDDPRFAYPLGHAAPSLPVGEKGQFTAAFLERRGRELRDHRGPDGKAHREPLIDAVSRWCRYLEIGHEVGVEGQGKLGYQLTLTVNGEARDMTAIGVGASQLLPVVVLVLGTEPDTVVLLEQPELHLHPAVQSRLANFFAIARRDIRLVVETHSEYLVTRLRYLVASQSIAPDRVKVLFTTQTNGATRFDELSMNTFGDFEYWPQDFFDTLDAEYRSLMDQVAHRMRTLSLDPGA